MQGAMKLTQKLNDILSDIWASRGKNMNTLEKLILIMNTADMKEVYNYYLQLEPLTEQSEPLLYNILQACNTIYTYSGRDTGLSDSDYDTLKEFWESETEKEYLFTVPISSDTSEILHHRYKTLRGTLDKIYKITDADMLKNKSQKSLTDWIKTTENRYLDATGETIDLLECDVMVMPKFDGVSCIFECDKNGNLIRALSRGDTARNEAQDFTHIFADIFHGPLTDANHEYGLKTEIMMLDDDLEKFNTEFHKDYKNTRSIVSSILNSEEKDVRADYLQVIPLRYSYLIDGIESHQYLAPGIFNFPYLYCKLGELDKIHEYAFSHKTVHPGLRCDGAVIYIRDEKIQKALGREHEKQKFEVAFKFTEEVAYSEVLDVRFTTGMFGRITPVVWFKTVKMKGNDISNAAISYRRFKDMELAVGDTIKILYDIIPYVMYDETDRNCTRSESNPIKGPKSCPDCGFDLTESETGDMLTCKNKDCPCREKGKILNYVKKMNIANISYATIDDFYKAGCLKEIRDLYALNKKYNKLIQMDGYGELKIRNILREINTHMEVTPSLLLGSIGIEGMSVKTFQKILQYISMDELMDIALSGNFKFFTVIPGIKDKTATKLINGIMENEWTINFLRNTLEVLEEPKEVKAEFKVVFTKVRDEDAERFIKDHDGSVSESVTKETDLVVVPERGVESGKTKLATKYGIPVVPLTEMEKYIQDKILK